MTRTSLHSRIITHLRDRGAKKLSCPLYRHDEDVHDVTAWTKAFNIEIEMSRNSKKFGDVDWILPAEKVVIKSGVPQGSVLGPNGSLYL